MSVLGSLFVGALMFSSAVSTGCRLGRAGGGMQTQTAMPGGDSVTADPDPRLPSERDPALSTTLPPRPAGRPYHDPTPPVTTPQAASPKPVPTPEPPMRDMPGM